MATSSEIKEVVNLMKSLPNSPSDLNALDNIVKLFTAVLEDLPVEMVKAAAVQYCSEGNPFFPMPGVIRDKAMELQMLALGIPSPAEAWGMVLTARQYVETVYCEESQQILRDIEGKSGGEYWSLLAKHQNHIEDCRYCKVGGFKEIYGHSAVEETVRLLGGREIILTDNPMADRARFIDAYREIVSRERMKMAMVPRVAAFVESVKPVQLQAGVQMKQLAQGLRK